MHVQCDRKNNIRIKPNEVEKEKGKERAEIIETVSTVTCVMIPKQLNLKSTI